MIKKLLNILLKLLIAFAVWITLDFYLWYSIRSSFVSRGEIDICAVAITILIVFIYSRISKKFNF